MPLCKLPTILQRFDCDFEMLCSGANRAHTMRPSPCHFDPGFSQVWGGGGGGVGGGAEPWNHLKHHYMLRCETFLTTNKEDRINFTTRKQKTDSVYITKSKKTKKQKTKQTNNGLPADCYFLLKFQLSSTVRRKPFQQEKKDKNRGTQRRCFAKGYKIICWLGEIVFS